MPDYRLTGWPHRLVVASFVFALALAAGLGYWTGTFDPDHMHWPMMFICGGSTLSRSKEADRDYLPDSGRA